jgi:hypothetical protein
MPSDLLIAPASIMAAKAISSRMASSGDSEIATAPGASNDGFARKRSATVGRRLDDDALRARQRPLRPPPRRFPPPNAGAIAMPVCFGLDQAGNFYLVDLGGSIFRIDAG